MTSHPSLPPRGAGSNRWVHLRVTMPRAGGHQANVMQPTAAKLRLSLAAIAMLAACSLPSRELGTKRERWTIFEPAERDDSDFGPLVATPDDGVILVASHWNGFEGDSELRRYDAEGGVRWSTLMDPRDSIAYGPTAIAVAADGTIVVGGATRDPQGDDVKLNRGKLLGFDPGGALLWTRDVEGTWDVSAVAVLPDGRVAYGGGTQEPLGVQIGIISTAGALGPMTRLVDPTLPDEVSPVESVVAQSTGGLVALLKHVEPNQPELVAFDADLARTWTHAGRVGAHLADLAVAPDDGILLLSHSDRIRHDVDGTDHWLANDNRITVLDADGIVEHELEGVEPGLQVRALALEPDGTIVIAGADRRSREDNLLGVAEIDPDTGETLWFDTAGAPIPELYAEHAISGVVVTASGDLVVAGGYDDRLSTGWRGWLRRYAARSPEGED